MTDIRPAQPADAPAAVDVLVDAFGEDRMLAAMLGRQSDRPRRLAGLFSLSVTDEIAHGAVDLAPATDGSVAGVAVWSRPTTRRPSVLAKVPALPQYLRVLTTRVLVAARVQHVLDGFRPRAPHWYLAHIGTSTTARGTGAATALLRSRLAEIDSRGEPAYLEAAHDALVPFYERFGFRPAASIPLPGATLTAMHRPAVHLPAR